MTKLKNFFATRLGIISIGAFIGVFASLLQKWGNPGNMGICVACFERDIAGAIGLLGLIGGIWIGTRFLKSGYNLRRTEKTYTSVGWMLPLIMIGFFVLLLIFPQIQGEAKSGILFYSVKGPGSMHAPLIVSLLVGLGIGFLAQRSRFCAMGSFRDLILFREAHLFTGLATLAVFAFITNLIVGQFHPGFAKQPVAHIMGLWNFGGMVLAGLAFCLAGGCPGR